MYIVVRDNDVGRALRLLRRRMQREGILRKIKMRSFYEKPSKRRMREKLEDLRRVRKEFRKRAQKEGLIPMDPPRRSFGKSPRVRINDKA